MEFKIQDPIQWGGDCCAIGLLRVEMTDRLKWRGVCVCANERKSLCIFVIVIVMIIVYTLVCVNACVTPSVCLDVCVRACVCVCVCLCVLSYLNIFNHHVYFHIISATVTDVCCCAVM